MGSKQSKLIHPSSYKKTSVKLLIAYKETNIRLSAEFICSICFGIIIYPMKCIKCDFKACRNCIKVSSYKQLICFCNKFDQDNFIPCIISKLEETEYLIQEDHDQAFPVEEKYNYALNKFLNISKIFPFKLASLDIFRSAYSSGSFSTESILDTFFDYEQKYYQKILKRNKIYLKLFNLTKVLKKVKMINFNYSKGYDLDFFLVKGKLYSKHSVLFQLIHIKSIIIGYKFYNITQAIAFAKAIRKSRKYLISFSLMDTFFSDFIEMKHFAIFCKAISTCSRLQTVEFSRYIRYDAKFLQFYNSLIEETHYNFFSYLKRLRRISLTEIVLLSNLKFEYFGMPFHLDDFELKSCYFQQNAFLFLMENVMKKKHLKRLVFEGVQILENDQKSIRNGESFQQLIFQQLKLETFDLIIHKGSNELSKFWDFPTLPFLLLGKLPLISNLQISLVTLEETFKEFRQFARNIEKAKNLKSLNLRFDNLSVKIWKSFLTSFTFNNSIILLNLNQNDLSNCESEVTNIIKDNHSIIKLFLLRCRLIISNDFAEALLINSSLLELDIESNEIDNPENIFSLMLKSKLQRIYTNPEYHFSEGARIIINHDPLKKIICSTIQCHYYFF